MNGHGAGGDAAASHGEPEAEALIRRLGLVQHPEGGHYRETFRAAPGPGGGRAACTAILFLLRAGERSHWHRVDADELWHWHAGAPLELAVAQDGSGVARTVLGADFAAGETPQGIVPARAWQAARSLGAWTLVGCTVAPAFEFAGFELAPPGWEPAG